MNEDVSPIKDCDCSLPAMLVFLRNVFLDVVTPKLVFGINKLGRE